MRRRGHQSAISLAYLQGWLACAMSAGIINLAEKGAAELAIEGMHCPEHLSEWWL